MTFVPCSIVGPEYSSVLITNHQPLFHICITSPVESAPFFIASTSSVHCPPRSPHPAHITSITPSTFYSRLKLTCFTNPFLHSLSGSIWTAFKLTDLRLIDLTKLALTFVCFSIFFLYICVVITRVLN